MSRVRTTLVAVLVPLALLGAAAPWTVGSAAAASAPSDQGAASNSSVSITRTVRRTHLVGGHDVQADKRTITLTVDRTQDLRSRQPVRVTWSGAHPTGDATADTTSPAGVDDEFPFLLLQCRGVDSTSVPAAQRITPQTCWTQTGPQERFTASRSTAFPPWRVDRYAPPSARTLHVGDPSPLPGGCDDYAGVSVQRVPFTAVNGTTYTPDGASCTPLAPENLVVDNASQPGNTTWGITRPDGRGDTRFTVWTTQDNASLGCSDKVACALVAVPVMGIGCDVAAAALPLADRPPAGDAAAVAKDCQSTGAYAPGQAFNGTQSELAVSGKLWFSESNWRNRITVPLTFALPDNVCDIVGGKGSTDLYGSELMAQAMIQWRPTFCLDPARTPFRHVQVGEPQAANLVNQGGVEAGLISAPPPSGFTRKVVNAPVAMTGFAIGYSVDDGSGARYDKLKLNARLLAKLLTMSYPGQPFVRDEYPALRGNPLDLSLDPEFQALNPGIKKGVANSVSASTLLSLSSDSNVVRALTTYLDADPEARSWLDGAPDPWGMAVNPSYRGISLPVQTWPQLDPFEPRHYYATGLNPCLQNSPVPYLPLIASPTIRLSNISFAVQFASSTSQVTCAEAAPGSTVGLRLVAGGRQSPGFRFVLGVTSLGDAARYGLDTAALQTRASAATLDRPFVDGAGRIFVEPDPAGLRAAARLLRPDDTTGTWQLPVSRILTDASDEDAYPGAMVVYAAVPTRGLPRADAAAYAELVSWMATTGQTPGTTNGTLPGGYLPLTAANGLGDLVAYNELAARAVADQLGAVPSVLMPAAAPVAVPTAETPAPVVPSAAPPVVTAPPPAAGPVPTSPPTTAPTSTAPTPAVPTPPAATPTTLPTSDPTAPPAATATASATSSTTSTRTLTGAVRGGSGSGGGSSSGGGSQPAAAPTAPFAPRLVAAAPTARAAAAGAPPGTVAQQLATLATQMGLAGNVPATLLLAALVSAAAVAITMLNRRLRGARG